MSHDDRILTPDRLSEIEDRLSTRDTYWAEIKSMVVLIRKWHPHEDAYVDLAATLSDLADDFKGAAEFKRLEREREEHDGALEAQDMSAARRAYHSSVL